jgi:hypothetical protein
MMKIDIYNTQQQFGYDPTTKRVHHKIKVVCRCESCGTLRTLRYDRYKTQQCLECKKAIPIDQIPYTEQKRTVHGQEIVVKVYARNAVSQARENIIWGNWEGELPSC